MMTVLCGYAQPMDPYTPGMPLTAAGTTAAQAKIQYINMDHTYWKEIQMEFPDVSGAKKLYALESWANSYEYNTQLLLVPWVLEVVYFLPDDTCVRRTYRKAGANAMLTDFIKAHAAFITDQIPASFS
ncbi:MAG TPA: hypothetical protein IAD32_03775 [Candidatus Scatavimonas merdigallinarum]|uniref:Uncharacterized protein n=1 Tax=Candidatus Scatavimonas merdigallinarum TaxID=2840914 RepID=A0A9D0ZJ99_9FIRM|nr:hypothetical protein [Candidatus Scatavimonas merdigallinarum]